MSKPNIIFILMDDLGWMDLGCYGSSFYETPNLDRLAWQSMRFTDAYAACPLCSPTRASLMTGKYPARIGMTTFMGGTYNGQLLSPESLRYLPLSEKTVAAALREGGYATWHVGKWHLGSKEYWPEKHGFDVNIGGWDRGMPTSYFSPYSNPMLADGPPGEYLTDRLTDEAITLIRNRGDKPFFLNFCHYAVHIPIEVPEHYIQKYKRKAASLGLDRKEPFEYGEFHPFERKKHQRIVRRLFQGDAAYAGMMQNLDENIGRLLGALDAEGLSENTVVIFTSDNGGLSSAEGSPTCNAPLCEGKGWMYEGGVREPLLVKWPGVTPPDSLCTVPVTTPDFYPTLLEMAGVAPLPQQHVDGVSIVPLLKGAEALEREAIYWHWPHYSNQGGTPTCSVRAGDYKLIEFFENDRVELYNLREDVGEQNDLSSQLPDVVKRLRGLLHDWLRQVDAKIPQINPNYQPHTPPVVTM